MVRKIGYIITLLGILLPAHSVAGILLVPHNYPTIQDAINASMDGDKVWVSDGLYTGSGNWDLDFNGKAIRVRSINGPENCIIDCWGSALNPRRAFYFHNGEGPDSIVEGFTIKRGYTYPGGAIYCNFNSSPTIRDNIFLENTAYCFD